MSDDRALCRAEYIGETIESGVVALRLMIERSEEERSLLQVLCAKLSDELEWVMKAASGDLSEPPSHCRGDAYKAVLALRGNYDRKPRVGLSKLQETHDYQMLAIVGLAKLLPGGSFSELPASNSDFRWSEAYAAVLELVNRSHVQYKRLRNLGSDETHALGKKALPETE